MQTSSSVKIQLRYDNHNVAKPMEIKRPIYKWIKVNLPKTKENYWIGHDCFDCH